MTNGTRQGDVYAKIIEDVIQASSTDFEESGVSQSTLLELQKVRRVFEEQGRSEFCFALPLSLSFVLLSHLSYYCKIHCTSAADVLLSPYGCLRGQKNQHLREAGLLGSQNPWAPASFLRLFYTRLERCAPLTALDSFWMVCHLSCDTSLRFALALRLIGPSQKQNANTIQ